MGGVPSDLRAERQRGVLVVCWHGQPTTFPFVFLRGHCQCAHCVNEWTGEQILDPATVSTEISIDRMELVGSYAVRIYWSDGHSSGLYTWERLQELRNLLDA